MELIDVNTQDFQYLTLSQFNGEKKNVRARCEMRKDEPFIQDTSNAFVCIEYSTPDPCRYLHIIHKS